MRVVVMLPKRSDASGHDGLDAPLPPDPWAVVADARQDRGKIIARAINTMGAVLTTIPGAANRRLRGLGKAIAGEFGKHVVISRRSRNI